MDKNKELEAIEDMIDYVRAKGIFVKSKKDMTDISNLLFGTFCECKTEYTFNVLKHCNDFVKSVVFNRLPEVAKGIEVNQNENQYIMLDNVFNPSFNSEFGGGLMDDLNTLNKFPNIYSDSFIMMEIRLVNADKPNDLARIEYRFLVLDSDITKRSIDLSLCDNEKWHKMFLSKQPIKDTKGYFKSYMEHIRETVESSDIKNVLFERYDPLEEDEDQMIEDFSYLLLCIFCAYVSVVIRTSETYKIPLCREED
jgi:hypothetical protein